jgi:flagellar basal body rod protein FlgC
MVHILSGIDSTTSALNAERVRMDVISDTFVLLPRLQKAPGITVQAREALQRRMAKSRKQKRSR